MWDSTSRPRHPLPLLSRGNRPFFVLTRDYRYVLHNTLLYILSCAIDIVQCLLLLLLFLFLLLFLSIICIIIPYLQSVPFVRKCKYSTACRVVSCRVVSYHHAVFPYPCSRSRSCSCSCSCSCSRSCFIRLPSKTMSTSSSSSFDKLYTSVASTRRGDGAIEKLSTATDDDDDDDGVDVLVLFCLWVYFFFCHYSCFQRGVWNCLSFPVG